LSEIREFLVLLKNFYCCNMNIRMRRRMGGQWSSRMRLRRVRGRGGVVGGMTCLGWVSIPRWRILSIARRRGKMWRMSLVWRHGRVLLAISWVARDWSWMGLDGRSCRRLRLVHNRLRLHFWFWFFWCSWLDTELGRKGESFVDRGVV
jgi:hypothetical protein